MRDGDYVMTGFIEPSYVVALIMTALGAVAWVMILNWGRKWEGKWIAQDERIEETEKRVAQQDVNYAKVTTDIEYITKSTDEIRQDVKELLKKSNGNRAAG